MSDATGKAGGPEGISLSAAGGGYLQAAGSAGGPQLAKILSVLGDEFGSFLPPNQLAAMMSSIRMVVGSGVPPADVADAMYSNPIALDALRDGNAEKAKQAIVSQLSETIEELRSSGVPEASLRALSNEGLAAGEIAKALRSITTLHDELEQSDGGRARQSASTLHQFFRDEGRTTHNDPNSLLTLGLVCGPQESWFEQYMNRIRAAARRSLSDIRPDDHPELLLGSMPVKLDESQQSVGPWAMALIVGAAVVLILFSHC